MSKDSFVKTRVLFEKVGELTNQREVGKRRVEYRQKLDMYTGDLAEEIGNLEEEIINWKSILMECLSSLPSPFQSAVMMKRYVDLKSWDEIAEEMNISVGRVLKLHGKALPYLEEHVDFGDFEGKLVFPEKEDESENENGEEAGK